MQLEEHVVGEVTILALSGRMTRNDHFGALTERVQDLVRAGRRKLVLDLGALGLWVSTAKKVAADRSAVAVTFGGCAHRGL